MLVTYLFANVEQFEIKIFADHVTAELRKFMLSVLFLNIMEKEMKLG